MSSDSDTKSIEKMEKRTCLSTIGNILGVFGAFALIGDMVTDSFSAKNYYERSLLQNGTDTDSYFIYFICTTTFICLPVTIVTLILGYLISYPAIFELCQLARKKIRRRCCMGCMVCNLLYYYCCRVIICSTILAIISVLIIAGSLCLSFIIVSSIWIFSPMLHIFFSLVVLFAKNPSKVSYGELFEKSKYWKIFAVFVIFLAIIEAIFEALPQTVLGFIFLIYQYEDPEMNSIQVSFTFYRHS